MDWNINSCYYCQVETAYILWWGPYWLLYNMGIYPKVGIQQRLHVMLSYEVGVVERLHTLQFCEMALREVFKLVNMVRVEGLPMI